MGGVWIGGDSAGIAGLSVTVRADHKVFQRGQFCFGFSGSFRLGQILQYQLTVPKPDKDVTDHEYMATTFIDAVRACFKKAGVARDDAGVESTCGSFLVAWKGQLYKIEADYQVGIPDDGFDACGCGEEYALGAMRAALDMGANAEEAVKKALVVSEHFSAGVRGPFTVAYLEPEQKAKRKK